MDSEYLSSKTKTHYSTSCDSSLTKEKDHSSTSCDSFSLKKKTHSSINSKYLSSKKEAHLNSRRILPKFIPGNRRPRHYGDRFIPNRSAMDINLAHSLLTTNFNTEKKGDSWLESPSKIAYRKALTDIFNVNQIRILSFKNRPPLPSIEEEYLSSISPTTTKKPTKRNRIIPQKEDRILDAPELLDDYYLNLLDWGSKNILSIALGNTVYLWNGSDGSTDELMSVDDDIGPITSVCWAPDGQNISIGLNSSHVEIWDAGTKHKLRTLHDMHDSRVGSLAWNKHILTSGSKGGKIVNSDVRVRSHVVQTYNGHNQEVCGLKWSDSGQLLASGGNDNLLHIWSLSTSAYVHRFLDHTAAVKALAWCPFQTNILASGGGDNDRCIRFWNTQTGACLNSVNTGSQVCSLLWSRKEREVLSAHGFTDNELILWKYPGMVKMAELKGHTSRVLYMAQSPDGCTVVSAAGDETLRFWKVFGDEDVLNADKKRMRPRSFVDSYFIR